MLHPRVTKLTKGFIQILYVNYFVLPPWRMLEVKEEFLSMSIVGARPG